MSPRGGTAAAFAAAIRGHEDQVLNSWPASLVRAPERGRAWDMTAPGITGDKAAPLSSLTAGTGTDGLQTNAYEATIFYLDVEAEVVRFSVGATTNGYP